MMGRTLAHYEILEKIGVGGMGEVYRAHDTSLDRDVAIKVLPTQRFADDTARKQFRQEALSLSKLNHPHIATIHAFDSSDGVDYLVMELVEGPTLREHLTMLPLMEEEILRISRQMAAAVAEAHERGIVHRDLKPANIKLTSKGQVKVLDFGLSTLREPLPVLSETDVTKTMEDASGVTGTLPYMAPEQLRGRPAAPMVDVWALGVMLYEAAARVRPFTGETVHEVAAAILNDPPPALPATVSAPLRGVILRCLQKDPQQRFQNAGEVRVALETLQSSTSEFLALPSASASRRPRFLGVGVAAAVIALLAAGFGWQMLRDTSEKESTTVTASAPSVVALPSTVVSDAEDDFFTQAIPRTLSNHLSIVGGLITRVPPTSQEFEQLDGDMVQIAAAYDVGALVVSSVTVDGEHLVLNVQLVEAGTRRLLWGSDFEGSRDVYLQLIRDAAQGVRAALVPGASTTSEPDQAQSSGAELAWQQGRYFLDLFYSRGSPEDLTRASDAYQKAMDLDPTFAGAAAGFAGVHLLEITRGADPLEAMAKAETWARYAIRQDERSSQAWLVLSAVQNMRPDGSAKESLEFALKAAAFDPRNHYAHAALAQTLAANSCRLAALAYAEAPRQNPLDLNSPAAAAGVLHLLGQRSEALSQLEGALRIEPNLPYALLVKTLVLINRGEPEAAAEIFERVEGLAAGAPFPPQTFDLVRHFLELEESAGRGGDKSAPATQVAKMARGEGTPFPFWNRLTQPAAPILARHGYTDLALEVLETRVAMGIIEPYDFLLWNPDLEPLRGDPRFLPVREAAKAGFDEMATILEEARNRDELPSYLDQALRDLLEQLAARSAG